MMWGSGLRRVPVERLYATMAEIRSFEEALAGLWDRGLISGELHLAVGEEGAVAGVVDHLRVGDSVATDHRSTPAFVARGCDLRGLTLEMLGHPDGLCGGRGGHMHLFDPNRLMASSGIVGASACTACGFALAHQRERSGQVAVAFFGEGASNQGMVLEALNLAAVWRLPVVFVCRDNGWAITTRSGRMTGGHLVRRARAFGVPSATADGRRPWTVWRAGGRAVRRARRGGGPTFLLVRVKRPRGHFEDDSLVRVARHPTELVRETRGLLAAALAPDGGPASGRGRGLLEVGATILLAVRDQLTPSRDPLLATERVLDPSRAAGIRTAAESRVAAAVAEALTATEASA